MKRSYEIEILGHKYNIKTEEDPEYVNRVAEFVNEKMKEVAEKGKIISTLQIAVLAAINIADELMKEREQREKQFRDFNKRSDQLIQLIRTQL
ncbi:MAG: cell division protein ZapA [Deltaproteobacteria bacterium]|nr:cell division protein ZapA [Deltaproteobacteria bacterium]